MASSGNFCVLNRADPSAYQIPSTGNLRIGDTGSSADLAGRGSTFYVKSGKWYWEIHQRAITGTAYPYVGISVGSRGSGLDANRAYNYGPSYYAPAGTLASQAAGYTGLGTLTTTDTGVTAATAGDIINFALDMDNRKFWIGLNGTFFNSGNPATGTNAQFTWTTDEYVTPYIATYTTNRSSHFNFGQDSSFAGEKSTGTESAADANGHGDFYDTPPSGFLALCTANLPISSNIDPAETDSEFPQKQFGIAEYDGTVSSTGVAQITHGLGFKPDFIWSKGLTSGQRWALRDSNRGPNQMLASDETTADSDKSGNGDMGTTFATDTTFPTNYTDGMNAGTGSFIAYCWKAAGATTSTNTSGTITSTVQANTAAGFSIVTFTSPNDSADQTVGHGLSASPDFIISKNRDTTYNWDTFHSGLSDTTKSLRLNTNEGLQSGRWGTVNDSIITTKNNYTHNSTNKYVFYVWHEVEGYSKFGTYVSNNNSNGQFIYTGFRPAIILFKGTVSGAAWILKDDTLDGSNPGTGVLQPSSTAAKYTTASGVCDIHANGFKITTNNAVANSTSYDPYIYAAWGSVPFKYGNTFP